MSAREAAGRRAAATAFLAGAVVAAGAPAAAAARDTPGQALAAAIERLAASAGGRAGVAILHVESGARLAVHGHERFPMASVYKLPIALQVLHRVDRGELALDALVRVEEADLRLGASPIAAKHPRGGVSLGLADLLGHMLVDSDNTACDLLFVQAGGAAAVSERMRALGAAGVRVDRPEGRIALDYHGVRAPPPEQWTLPRLRRLLGAAPAAARDSAAAFFLADPRDTATPDAMADLLARTARGQALSEASTKRLLDWMTRTPTGPRRLKGRLPAGTPVAHKTGTWWAHRGIRAAVNDVGIVTLPGGAGHLAIAVFVKGSDRSLEAIEAAIAGIARAAYDHWTRPAGTPPGGGL